VTLWLELVARRQLDKQIVVETACDIADAEGLDAITLTRVARELSISQPALYRHVEGYDDLIRSLSLKGRQLIADELVQAAIGLSTDDAVRAMGLAWRRVADRHPGLYAATDRFPCAGDLELEGAVERIVAILSQALVGYGLSEDEQVHAARSLRSAFHGFTHLEAGDGHPLSQDLDDTFDHLIELLCAGIRALE
jgi:AcrR family transcriptional regulator